MARVYLGVWYIIGGHLTVNTHTHRHLDGESILGGLVYNWGSSHTVNTHTYRHLDGESILGGLVYNWGSSHSQTHTYTATLMVRVYLGVWYIIGGHTHIGGHLTINTHTHRHLDGESILGGLVYNWGSWSSHSKLGVISQSTLILTATTYKHIYLPPLIHRHLDGESILGGLVYNWGSSHNQHSYSPLP